MGSSQMDYGFEFFAVSFPAQYVALVEINRPNKMNAFKEPMWEQLQKCFEQLSIDPDVRSIVFSAKGDRAFTAGLDVEAAASEGPLSSAAGAPDPARSAFTIRRLILEIQRAVNAIEACSKPVVCAAFGYAFGLAIDVGTSCDVRLCASDVKFSVREAAIGLAADLGTLTRLPKIGCSLSWVKEMAYTARVFGAREAERAGFVSEVVDGGRAAVIKRAVAIATEMANLSPVAVQSTKRVIDFSRDHSISDGLEYVSTWNAAMLQTEDVQKAMTSGLKRQTPYFSKL